MGSHRPRTPESDSSRSFLHNKGENRKILPWFASRKRLIKSSAVFSIDVALLRCALE
jgi:hypothetical protein